MTIAHLRERGCWCVVTTGTRGGMVPLHRPAGVRKANQLDEQLLQGLGVWVGSSSEKGWAGGGGRRGGQGVKGAAGRPHRGQGARAQREGAEVGRGKEARWSWVCVCVGGLLALRGGVQDAAQPPCSTQDGRRRMTRPDVCSAKGGDRSRSGGEGWADGSLAVDKRAVLGAVCVSEACAVRASPGTPMGPPAAGPRAPHTCPAAIGRAPSGSPQQGAGPGCRWGSGGHLTLVRTG